MNIFTNKYVKIYISYRSKGSTENRVGRVTFKMDSDTVTNYLLKNVVSDIITVIK